MLDGLHCFDMNAAVRKARQHFAKVHDFLGVRAQVVLHPVGRVLRCLLHSFGLFHNVRNATVHFGNRFVTLAFSSVQTLCDCHAFGFACVDACALAGQVLRMNNVIG